MVQSSAVKVAEYRLSPGETQAVAELSEQAAAAGPQAADVADAAAGIAHSLPGGLLASLREFRAGEMAHAIRISNLPLDTGQLPPTSIDSYLNVPKATAVLGLLASVLGDLYGFAAQQGGKLINDIMPSPESVEIGNISSGSREPFPFHTEDTFHSCFPDYVMFLCLKNPDLVPLLISAPDSPVSGDMWNLLSKPGFPHRASPSHGGDDAPAAWVRILFGHSRAPSIRVNLANLDRSGLGGRERDAVCALETMLRRNATEIPLHVADCVILDNMRTVHGRKPFQARFDGSDRWLKRAIVSRDFRRCMAWSPQSAARTLGASYV
jgi:hypothetical protein